MEQVSIINYERMSKNLRKDKRLYYLGNESKNVSCISDSDSALRQMNAQRRRTILKDISAIVLCIRTCRIDRNFHSAFDLLRCDSWDNACDYVYL